MNSLAVLARAGRSACVVVVSLLVGCAQQAGRAPRATLTVPAADAPAELTAGQEQRAEALALFAAGVSLEIRQGIDAALDYYKRAFAADPHNVDLAMRIANLLLSRRQFGEARALLQEASARNAKSAEPLFWLGVAAKGEENLPAAAEALRQALKVDPTHINAIHLLAEILLQQNAEADVIKLLEQSWRQKSADFNYWLRLGDLYTLVTRQKKTIADQLDKTRALRCYEKAQTLAPEELDIAVRLASLYESEGDLAKAAELYQRIVARRPGELPLRLKLASLYLQADHKDKAAAELEEIIRREPLRYELYNQLADIYDDLNQNEKALSNYQQSLAVNPAQDEVYARVAMLHMGLKRFAEAKSTLERWKDKSPTDFRIPYLQGLIFADNKQYEAAVAAYADAELLAAESPREVKLNAQFYFAYGAACERAGDHDRAVVLFKKVIALDSEDHLAHNYLGYMWADKGVHLEEAYELIKIANTRHPDNGAYLDSLGWVLYRLGRFEEAVLHLLRAVELEQDDVTCLDHLADVLLKLGRTDEARQYLQRAVKMAPDNQALAEKLQKLTGTN